jgi:hypothetical protein
MVLIRLHPDHRAANRSVVGGRLQFGHAPRPRLGEVSGPIVGKLRSSGSFFVGVSGWFGSLALPFRGQPARRSLQACPTKLAGA